MRTPRRPVLKNSSLYSDRPIVRVLGVVMARNDSIGGWVPFLEGGQSKVGIHESLDGKSFRIYGWRISDKKVTLDCCIQTSMTFHETNGTFHHWQIGNRRMGLTFYSPAEARSFDRGIRVALDKLEKVAANSGSGNCCESSSSRPESRQSTCHSPTSSTGSSSSLRHHLSRKSKKKTSSTSSMQAPARPAKPARVSTKAPTQMPAQSISPQVVHSGLSVLSATSSSLQCATPVTYETTTSHFRYPITNLTTSHTFKPTSSTALLSAPVPHLKDLDNRTSHTIPKTNGSVLLSTIASKDSCNRSTMPTNVQHSRHSQRYHRQRVSLARRNEDMFHTSGSKTSKSTKTPHLDYLEQHRDRQPAEQNSYVMFASAKPKTDLNSPDSSKNFSRSVLSSSLTRRDYNTVTPFTNPTSKHSNSTYKPATIGHERLYNARELYDYDKTKSEVNITDMYESGNRLLSASPPAKTKGQQPQTFFNTRDKYSDISDNESTSCCCFCKNPFRKSRSRRSGEKYHKEDLAERSKCKYCNEMFVHTKNKPGVCREAPDPCLKCIEGVTCMDCAKKVLRRCSENSDAEKPCTCSCGTQEGRPGFFCRWSALTALSIIIPCLCLYPPLRTCHCCAVKCQCCGGKHEASSRQNTTDKISTLKR